MKNALIAATAVLFLLCPDLLRADMPMFEKEVRLKDGSMDLKVSSDATPTSVDWNNDGAKDLICGQYTYGYIWLYLNKGTDLNPVFNGRETIKSNGVPITTTYG